MKKTIKQCRYCGKDFETRRAIQVYCDQTCRKSYHIEKKENGGPIDNTKEENNNIAHVENINLDPTTYDNPYAINKAIEQLLEIKGDSEYTIDEKVFLEFYSGYGGLDKYAEKIDKRAFSEFYTPDKIVKIMWGLAFKHGYTNGPILEPSVGTGKFLKYVPAGAKCVGYEISEPSYKIVKILYPQYKFHLKPFESIFFTGPTGRVALRGKTQNLDKYDLVIGNPPYGNFEGTYAATERSYTKATGFVDYFITRGLDLLNTGGLLVFIIGVEVANGGKPWLSLGNTKVKEAIQAKANLLEAYRLPNGVFDRTDVVSDIIVLQKK